MMARKYKTLDGETVMAFNLPPSEKLIELARDRAGRKDGKFEFEVTVSADNMEHLAIEAYLVPDDLLYCIPLPKDLSISLYRLLDEALKETIGKTIEEYLEEDR